MQEWKYDCVCNMVAQIQHLEAVLPTELRVRLSEYKDQGPFARHKAEL